jgi:small-conductance mechanosensitive channel
MRVLRDDARRAGSASRPSSCRRTRPRSRRREAIAAGAALVVVVAPIVLDLPLAVMLAAAVLVAAAALVAVRDVLSNALAGIALLLARPYSPGERVRLYAPELRATVDAEVVRVGLVQTTLASPSGVFVVPNTRLLRTPPAAGLPH